MRSGLRGVTFGIGYDGTLELRFMPVNADIQNGDVLVTSGIDGIYPPGLPVAVVSNIERNAAYAFARITCTPAAGGQQLQPGADPVRRRCGPGVPGRPIRPASRAKPQKGEESESDWLRRSDRQQDAAAGDPAAGEDRATSRSRCWPRWC